MSNLRVFTQWHEFLHAGTDLMVNKIKFVHPKLQKLVEVKKTRVQSTGKIDRLGMMSLLPLQLTLCPLHPIHIIADSC